ncbi:MAG: radical SAM protein, partial [Planctomycetota bacterium]
AAEALRLARLVRQRRPDVAIAMGGPLFNVHPERWLEGGWLFELTDYLVLGDGAQSVVALADALEGRGSFDAVRNLVRRVDGRLVRNDASPWLEPIDDLALPDFESAPMERFLTPQPIYPLMLSRGCYWGRCTFCSIGWRENYRMLRPENIERHARQLSQLGARYVQLQDSSVPPRGARLLAETVARESLGLHWEGGFKFSTQLEDPEYCTTLHAGGCRSLKMGLESMNQGVLDLMDKGFDVERVPTMLQNLRQAGISAEMLWFIGFPTEGLEDVLRTVRFLHERRDLFGLTAFVGDYALHPDTIVFDQPERFGVTVTGQENGYCSYEVAKGLSQAETLELKQILAGHNNRTLVCNGSHLPHLVESGLDLTDIARPPSDPRVLTEALAQR